MANLGGTFDPQQHQPVSFEPLQDGYYQAQIVASSTHQTNNLQGYYLKLEMEVIEGSFKGRKVWDQLNLWNPSQKAAQIAQGVLSSIARALNVGAFEDSSVLHNKPLMIYVQTKNGNTEIKAYKPLGSDPSQASPGRAFAEQNQPEQTPSPQNAPTANQAHLNEDGSPKSPQQMMQG
ncbi:DUF669 domain-containing protein [Hydrogenovibrio sp. 3SP14C1]|uniref:DUF669 domain-containing protein n=1 Tax=Hydrogenovibrio crunogenus (strain DSM 25203 / XCL-2) TaxID=317025 RepID=Q31HV6_HYDCU|nr:DUF669 domain-containing protein [Hydrogenovibrio sp. 3SP14C1]MDG4811915.1 DUF669 domain-containing protein [Hydrogenovibrio sp. 3SP14C1]